LWAPERMSAGMRLREAAAGAVPVYQLKKNPSVGTTR
jgi:hypothetical protein